MKRKYLLCLTAFLIAGYMFVCLVLFFGLDMNDKKPNTWMKKVAHKVQDKWQKDAVGELIKDRCVCDFWVGAPSSSAGRGKTSAAAIRELSPGEGMCLLTEVESAQHHADVQMLSLYGVMKISYPQYVWTHTGWNQNYHITYSSSRWNDNPLTVFLVPFSHIDPGWRSTESECYSRAKKILDLAMDRLTSDLTLTFVWGEVIYLRRWFESASATKKAQLKSVLRSGRFEIATGGWVMPDEATTHIYSLLDQLIEGHHWLSGHLNYTVRTAWNVDAFGASGGAVPYLLRGAGVRNLVVQRAHYAVQHHLAGSRQLEFMWEQPWDTHHQSGLFTHLCPFLSYNMLYSCGPDVQVCCQFDFYKKKCWEWGQYKDPEAITKDNIATKAASLLDQWRKKAELYKHHFLLMPHGDDFRYESAAEWNKQIGNLRKLMDYMNNDEAMRVQVKFGTLQDYFDAVHTHAAEEEEDTDSPVQFPTLSGDFLTYSDRSDQYWSGYYTSRPFLKSMVRRLQAQLRAGEALFTLSLQYGKQRGGSGFVEMLSASFKRLEVARRVSGLLQHHDAITGTAKAKVVTDYLQQCSKALVEVQHVLSTTTSVLLQVHHSVEPYDIIKPLEQQASITQYPQQAPIPSTTLEDNTMLVVFNPLGRARVDTVTVVTGRGGGGGMGMPGRLGVQDDHTRLPVPCQIDPVFRRALPALEISDTEYQLTFVVTLAALSITRYRIVPVEEGACSLARISIYNLQHNHTMTSIFPVEWLSFAQFSIHNQHLEASFCHCSGLMQSVTTRAQQVPHSARVHLMTYGTGHWAQPLKDRSGAYIFAPDGDAQDVPCEHPLVVVSVGPVMQTATTVLPSVTQKVTLYNVNGSKAFGVCLENTVDLRTSQNTELAMRIVTDLHANSPAGEAEFYTDSNGFQMFRRRTLSKLPLQGNVYPVTSLLYVEDINFRISLHMAQSHGATSLYPGQLEVMLDRTLAQDDWRGLGEGVQDNVPAVSRFVLTVETLTKQTPLKAEQAAGFPSMQSHLTTLLLEQPVIVQLLTPHPSAKLAFAPFAPLSSAAGGGGLPCDVHLHALRTMVGREGLHGNVVGTVMLLRRAGVDCRLTRVVLEEEECVMSKDGKVQWQELFSQLRVKAVREVSITAQRTLHNITETSLHIPPMELKAYSMDLLS